MKTKTTSILAMLLATTGLQAREPDIRRSSTATAEAPAEATADGTSHVTRKSVTVTSDGNKTIRKTVTVQDGKEEVVTEITDSDGKVTRTGGDDGQDQPDNPPAEETGAWLGVNVEAASDTLRDQLGLAGNEGVVVKAVANDSPAANAGIRVNDILLTLDASRLSNEDDLRAELRKHDPGDTISLEILRKGQKSTESVTLGERKEDPDGKTNAAERNNDSKTTKVEIHVDGGGAEAHATAGDSLDDVLDDPNVPEHFKKTVRDMKQRMEDFQREHQMK